ncbi:AIM24 family protein [Clostridium tarantellae]|uniref:AIM24 family protein n=1 Tax=Clostridium tarantellae TaxID=39493 RepID=A0A6I1MJD3_9CLOT|nr:AIM24 family protein [Clostridium tarantellae]MPQ43495.1 AIM24 family protein [Clostridium tarantellae]
MRTTENVKSKLKMLSEMRGESLFQVLEHSSLKGSKDIETAIKVNHMREAGINLRQVRIVLNESAVHIESGALSYMRGPITVTTKVGNPISFGKRLFASKANGETLFRPKYSGTGEIFLEPSFAHYCLIELEDDEVIIDDGLFYACEESIQVDSVIQKKISSLVLGNEGFFQTRLRGNGIVALEIPVPESEIFRCKINDDVLKVDGNFAILRTGDIDFTVEKSSKSIVGSSINGEGLVNVFRGTGEIWLIPTKIIYEKLVKGEIEDINTSTRNLETIIEDINE